LLAILREGYNEGSELAIASLVEGNLDMELLLGVDLELGAWAVIVVLQLIDVVLTAFSSSVAIVVEAFAVWGIARVSSCLPSPLVGLLEVELGTEVAVNFVGVTVVVTISFPGVAILVLSWHANHVDGSDTAAAS
jgi:hypothetical protein